MGLAGQNQVRHMFVGQAPATDGSVDTYADLKSAGASNDFLCLGSDGQAVSAGADFKFFSKGADGVIIASDTIKAANVLSAKSVAYAAPVNKLVTISGLTVDVNTLYTVKIDISQVGSLSQEDTYMKQGYYKAVSGDNAEAIVDGLIASLNRNFAREVGANATSNPYFTFAKTGSGATAALTVEGKLFSSNFDGDKKIKIYNEFDVDISCETYPTVEITNAASEGSGTGYQVVEMEHFLLGERGDTYRLNGYPHNIVGPGLVSDPSKSYNFIEIAYYDEGRDEAKKSKKGLTIASEFTNLAGNAQLNAVIADLNTILGASTVDALATS